MLSVRENVRSLSDRHPLHCLTQSLQLAPPWTSAVTQPQALPCPAPAHVLSPLRQYTCAVTSRVLSQQKAPLPLPDTLPAACYRPKDVMSSAPGLLAQVRPGAARGRWPCAKRSCLRVGQPGLRDRWPGLPWAAVS